MHCSEFKNRNIHVGSKDFAADELCCWEPVKTMNTAPIPRITPKSLAIVHVLASSLSFSWVEGFRVVYPECADMNVVNLVGYEEHRQNKFENKFEFLLHDKHCAYQRDLKRNQLTQQKKRNNPSTDFCLKSRSQTKTQNPKFDSIKTQIIAQIWSWSVTWVPLLKMESILKNFFNIL